jgi:hypothetical protein
MPKATKANWPESELANPDSAASPVGKKPSVSSFKPTWKPAPATPTAAAAIAAAIVAATTVAATEAVTEAVTEAHEVVDAAVIAAANGRIAESAPIAVNGRIAEIAPIAVNARIAPNATTDQENAETGPAIVLATDRAIGANGQTAEVHTSDSVNLLGTTDFLVRRSA